MANEMVNQMLKLAKAIFLFMVATFFIVLFAIFPSLKKLVVNSGFVKIPLEGNEEERKKQLIEMSPWKMWEWAWSKVYKAALEQKSD